MGQVVDTLVTRLGSGCWSTLRIAAIAAVVTGSFSSESVMAQRTARVERRLAPGVLTTIAPALEPDDTVSTHDVVEIRANRSLQWNPAYLAVSDTLHGKSIGVPFRRSIWCLEFAFKPLRMVDVSVVQPSGAVRHQQVWYLVYRVRNTGTVLEPQEGASGEFNATIAKGGPVQLVPELVLTAHDRDAAGKRIGKSYLDQVIPAAVEAIARRESLTGRLLNSAEISAQPIPVSDDRVDRSVWGVATWSGVDPRIDFFSIYVNGLTNAYRWEDPPGGYKPGRPLAAGRRFMRKTLQLNFWRPGDEIAPNEREFRYGAPLGKSQLYDVGDGIAYQWVYR